MNLTIFLGSFGVLLVLGAPIYLCLIVPSIIYIALNPGLPMLMMTQKLSGGVNSFPLMALPFFILAGAIMNGSSVTNRIFSFAKVLVGHFRGGLGYVNILASVIFSGMSGSAVADAGGLGQVELKAMKNAGFDDDFSIGVTAASSCIGPIIPPSIPFVIFATFASVSTGALFMGGILPGLLMAVGLSIACYFISKKRNYPREPKVGLKGIWRAFRDSWLALMMPVIIIGGIWTGWFTATEAALVSIVYAMALGLFVYRDLTPRKLIAILRETLDMVLPIMMIIVAATLFTWVLSYEKFDVLVLNMLMSLTRNRSVIILIICAITFLLGLFFEGTVIIMFMVPILLPISKVYDINVIHLGVTFILGVMLGLLTPPVGMTLYVLATVTKKPVMTIARYCAPWLIPLIAVWLIIAFWDPLVLIVPRLMGFGLALE